MKNKLSALMLIPFFLIAFFAGVTLSCRVQRYAPDPQHVAAVSGGVLGRTEPVRVEFHRNQDTSIPLTANVLTFRPAARGTVSWLNEYTLVFTPEEPLRPNQRYEVTVNLEGIPSFSFDFMTAPPIFNVQIDPVQISGDDDVFVSGTVSADADALISRIEQTISSRELGRPSWTHGDGVHSFMFNSISRGEGARTAEITWDGRPIGSDVSGFTTVLIPGTQEFEVLSLQHRNGVIEVSFSSPIMPQRDLRGFISIGGNTNVRYSLEGNIIRIFDDSRDSAGAQLLIQDLQDINGRRLAVPVQFIIPERWELPQIRFSGTGTILPTSQGAQLVVETRNVSGLIVEAFQIYENNMRQFLQVNPLSGTTQLDRVGEPVWSQAFYFSWVAMDQNRWVRRGLDLTELSRNFPGGMFHLRVSFRHRHVQFECEAGHGDFSHLEFPDDTFPRFFTGGGEPSFWDLFTQSPNYNWSEWNRHRRDPCHPSFFIRHHDHNITISRNVLVSDLGLMAKRALDGSWILASTNIITARPSPNTPFRVYNFQGRILHQGRTDSDGMARIPAPAAEMGPGSRLFIFAENSLGRAYLRINDALALAVSHFDVAGGAPSTGIRGLIYGERGIWRPGDNIYLTFLLSDPQGTLPQNHPVSFEFEDPRGRITLTRTFTSSVDGFFPILISTPPDAPTGEWIARVRVGGNVFTRSIRVETVMPNRLRMDLDFGGGDFIRSAPQNVSLEAEWLFGAPAPGLRADISVSFADSQTIFPGFTDFSFRDPSRTVSSERQVIWEGNLDSAGRANFTMTLNPGARVPGRVMARFITRVFEPSGVFSQEQISMEYSPYKRYVGVRLPRGDAARGMLLTDTYHTADIVLLDEDGNFVQENVDLTAAIYQLSWRWWWEMGGNEAADIAATLARNPISRQNITATNGRASWNFRINHPNWGRYLVIIQDAEGGHAAAQIVYIDWPGWAGRPQEGTAGAMLTLTAERASYNVGERVAVSFPSNRDAAAWVVVEKGGEVIRSEWINTNDGMTRFEFVAEPSMVPNVYVHVALLQPHLQTQNDLPIRLYGIIPVMIDDPMVILHPRITTQENWQAESTVSFTVSEASGRPMAYTVAVVDEGLLGLTRHTLPNPRNTFYAREASFLKSWDIFNEVIGAYSGRLETLLAIGGGDGAVMPDTDRELQRFRPVVRFFGPYEIGPGGSRTTTFELPPYVGALRIMVMAASATNEAQVRSQRAYGTAETTVRVTSDLMVFASLPRVLSPDDEVVIPVHVNSHVEGNRNVRVSLSVPGAEIIGASAQNLRFDRSTEQLIRFRVRAPANPGALQFTVRAESSGLRTAQHVVDMEVRSTAIPVTTSLYRLIPPGETWTGNLTYPGREGTNTLVAEFSRLPPLNLDHRLGFLIRYPHGCVEQITSGVFPQLYLGMILNLDQNRRAEIRTNVNAGIERILRTQLTSGGFPYWPGGATAHDWVSSYVGHFLLEARRLGYNVPESAIRSWVSHQRNAAVLWQASGGRFTEQAYRLYTLALAGEADMGSMNRLRGQPNLPLQASWRLAAAYWHSGQRDIARNMIQGLALPEGYFRELSGTFGSTLRDRAMIMGTLFLINTGPAASANEQARMRVLFEEITRTLSSDRWLSTQETAFALVAIAPFIQMNARGELMNLDFTVAGRSGNVRFGSPITQEFFGEVAGTSTPFTVTNRSASAVYVKFSVHGLPEEGREPAISNGLALAVEFRSSDGVVIRPEDLRLGEDMDVIVTLRNTFGRSVEEIALVVPVPASWEIINTRLAGPAAQTPIFRFQDIRDDRVKTYFDLAQGETRAIRFMVTKTYEGRFYRPAIHAYAMYDESIRAVIPGVRWE